jgi:nucleoside-diphosphate-sugar epimerase
MKKVLVTGSSGFIGRHLVAKLIELKYQVLESSGSASANLCIMGQVNKLPQADIIVHMAARSFIPDSFKDPQGFYSNNLISTLNILEKARKDGSKLIYLSTYVYGVPQYLPIDELHPVNPLNPYTQSKVMGEDLCRAYFRDFEVPSVVLRLFNVYGPGQGNTFFIPSILSQLKKPLIELQDSRPRRDFIFIDDVISAIVAATKYVSNGFDIFNVGSGKSVSISQLAEIIRTLSGTKAEIRFMEQIRQGEILDTVADISRIKSVLNWNTEVSLENGIRKILALDSKNGLF